MDYDISLKAIYVNNKETNEFPSQNAGYEFDKVKCSSEATPTWNNDSWSLEISNLTNLTECSIYFKSEEKEVPYNNPKTGTFINISLIILIIAITILIIRKVRKNNKFYKI